MQLVLIANCFLKEGLKINYTKTNTFYRHLSTADEIGHVQGGMAIDYLLQITNLISKPREYFTPNSIVKKY